jgi:hypothetical protein
VNLNVESIMAESKPPPGTEDDEMAAFPGAADKMFESIAKAQGPASSFSKGQDWYFYINGYKDAADLLVTHAAKGDPRKLLYPVMFLYRQHLELALKDLIRDCRRLLGWQEAFPKTHRIDDLWRLCIGLLNELSPGTTTTDETTHTTRLIADFCMVDPTSEAFRYPEGKDGEPTPFDVEIDFTAVKEVVGKISLLLDCTSTHVNTQYGDNAF